MRYFQRFLLSVGFLLLTVACTLFASYTLSEYPLLDFKVTLLIKPLLSLQQPLLMIASSLTICTGLVPGCT